MNLVSPTSRSTVTAPAARSTLAWLCLCTVLVAAPLHAAPEAAFEQAYQQFDRAGAGDDAALERAAEAFAALLRAEPTHPVLMAYLGSATAMKARTTMLPWKKMSHADDGLGLLDKALALLAPAHDAPLQHGTPAVLEVKFIAASTFLAVPGFMNRGARGARLLAEVLNSPLLATAPLPFRGAVWMRAAKQARADKRPADARRWLGQVVEHGAPQAAAARAALKEMAS
jgi:hypothetical protein